MGADAVLAVVVNRAQPEAGFAVAPAAFHREQLLVGGGQVLGGEGEVGGAQQPLAVVVGFARGGDASDVSSCIIHSTVKPGQHVAKGEELGHFQYGGSTHCLVFRPGAIAEFTLAAVPQPHDPNAPLVLVRSKLATANTTA